MSDSALTPHLIVDAEHADVRVPRQFVTDGKIVLNVSLQATRGLSLGNDAVFFEARFAGQPQEVYVPLAAVLGIYARESGQGMIFNAGDEDDPKPPDGGGTPEGPVRGPRLKVVK